MKKNYIQSITTGLLLLLGAGRSELRAQLSGLVTIDSSQPTSGSVYSSFSALATTLNAVGVNGPLLVSVAPGSGPYIEQAVFSQPPGISATNTITFIGNNCTISFSAPTWSSSPYTFLLDGADYFTVNNLNMIGASASWGAMPCVLRNNANYNTFNNCTFSVNIGNTNSQSAAFSINSSSMSPASNGPSGNYNTVNSCTMTGGFYGVVFAGPTGPTFATDNRLLNSKITEFYSHGIYNICAANTVIRGNILERPTRSNTDFNFYGIRIDGPSLNLNGVYEKNHIRNLTGGDLQSTAQIFAIYNAGVGTVGAENKIRNNIISDFRSYGFIAGVYIASSLNGNSTQTYCWLEHNTVSINDPNAPNTAFPLTYGIYSANGSNRIRNNIVSIARGGTLTPKYGLYFAQTPTPMICDYNDVYVSPANTNNSFFGFRTQAYLGIATWQTATGFDMNSANADPVFVNPTLGNYEPTAGSINNLCQPVGITTDFNNATRNALAPDPGALEFYNTPCMGTPPPTSFVTPTATFCPGTVLTLSLSNINTYTNSGYSVQWYASTATSLGPYSAVSNAVQNIFITPQIVQSTYYIAVTTCSNGQGSYTTSPGFVQIAPTVTNTVPYYESFESVAQNNELPNCSWLGTNMGGATRTYTSPNSGYRLPRTGAKYATFVNSPLGTNYFYSNGIQLNAGITYSAALWFVHDIVNLPNWSNLSIMIGMAQNPAAMTEVVSTNGTLTPYFYTLLSNTISVSIPGLYYIGVRATSTTGVGTYLSFDDLSVTIPCQLNTVPLLVNPASTVICSNQSMNIYAAGADTYQWNTGSTNPSIPVSPQGNTNYTVVGTSTLTGCTETLISSVQVKQAPIINAFVNDPVSCPGTPVVVSAQGGGNTYSWSTGASGATATVNPMVTTVYSVTSTNSLQCSDTGTVEVQVNPAPNVSASASSTLLCTGSPITFIGSGANTYQWLTGSNSALFGTPLVAYPSASGTWTLVGTDANGCEGRAFVHFGVEECTGIAESNKFQGVTTWPNPVTDKLNLEMYGMGNATVQLTDVSGRMILSETLTSEHLQLNLTDLANGMYYLKVNSDRFSKTIRVVKQ